MTQTITGYFKRELPGIPVRFCLIAALILHICAAWFSEGYLHPDEHFQILEFANCMAGKSPSSDLPWEFRDQIRPTLQPLLAATLYRADIAAGLPSPFFLIFLLRLAASLAGWGMALALCIACFRWMKHGGLKKLLFLFSCFFFYLPVLHARFTSENMAGIMFFAGLLAIVFSDFSGAERKKTWPFLVAGALLGLSFYFRFQIGFALAGLGLWLLFIRKTGPREIALMLAAFLLVCLVNIGLDHRFYGRWVLTPWNYFRSNILQGAARGSGVSPFWYYIVEILGDLLPPLSILILACVVYSCIKCRRNPLVWSVVPFIVAHSAIAHKETRFILPMLYALPPLLVLGLDALESKKLGRLQQIFSARWVRNFAWFFIIVNAVLLAAFTFKPAREFIPVYRWLYRESATRPMTVVTLKTTPYSQVKLPINFYRPPSIRIDTLRSAGELLQKTQQAAGPVHVFVEGFAPPDSLKIGGLTWTPECHSIPPWMQHFNVSHWLSRVQVWTVFAVTEKKL